MNKVEKILDFMIQNNVELISHGLAPNPFGFCFEVHNPKTPDHVLRYIDQELESLNSEETEYLIKIAL
jgi:hypothetical protein